MIGLLVTGDGIPIAHHVFAGSTNDAVTLPGVLAVLQQRFGVGPDFDGWFAFVSIVGYVLEGCFPYIVEFRWLWVAVR